VIMAYLGWKNHQTHKAWEEVVRRQDDILPMVTQVVEGGTRGRVPRLAVALDQAFRSTMPLQEIQDERYVHDFWATLLELSFGEIDWRSIASNIFWQLANPEMHPAVAGKGGRKQDWSARDRLWTEGSVAR